MNYKDNYLENIKSVLEGDIAVKKDTTTLNIPVPERTND
jgi:hypothetical protein